MIERVSKFALSILLIAVIMLTFTVGMLIGDLPEHNCSGEHCVICLTSSFSEKSLELFSVAVSALSLFYLASAALCVLSEMSAPIIRSADLVCLKVKLTD